MKRALLIGVSGGGIDVELAAERLCPVLEQLGFTSIDLRQDRRATRAGILDGLDGLLRSSEPGDAIFIHYFGHGGRVRFVDLEPEQVSAYVTCTKASRGRSFEAVLDRELVDRLMALDARCGNVTAMFDCCFSGELVRGTQPDPALSSIVSVEAPPWAKEALGATPDHELALDSNPRIVRICGASPKREAFAVVRRGRHIGRLTEAFLAGVSEAGPAWPRLTWATLGHRMREHVIDALAMESQWVALAGPRTRRLFTAETVELPGSVGFVPADEPGRGWLRAGWHQGVSVGDRWQLIEPTVDEEGRARPLVELTVCAVKRNRSEVTFAAELDAELRPGMPALLAGLAAAPAVIVAVPQLEAAVAASPWLRCHAGEGGAGEDEVLARVREVDGMLELDPEASDAPRLRLTSAGGGYERALALLEDQARLRVLERSLADGRADEDCPLRWTWARVGEASPLPAAGATLEAGARIRVDLEHPPGGPPLNWFVSVIYVDPSAHLRLLTTRMPEGLELGPGDRECVGVRRGRRGAQGIELTWPAELAGECELAPAKLLILASRRPIELAHIVRPQAVDEDQALALQGLARETTRARKPEHTRGCAWARFDFNLRPN